MKEIPLLELTLENIKLYKQARRMVARDRLNQNPRPAIFLLPAAAADTSDNILDNEQKCKDDKSRR